MTGKSTCQPPKADSVAAEQDTQLPTNIEPEPKGRKLDKKENPKDKYHSPKQASKNVKETRPDQPDNIQLRRSSRIPKVTKKTYIALKLSSKTLMKNN